MSTHKFMFFAISLFREYKLKPFSGIMITKYAIHVTVKSRAARNFHASAHTTRIQISSLLFHRQSLNLVWDKDHSTVRLSCVGRWMWLRRKQDRVQYNQKSNSGEYVQKNYLCLFRKPVEINRLIDLPFWKGETR